MNAYIEDDEIDHDEHGVQSPTNHILQPAHDSFGILHAKNVMNGMVCLTQKQRLNLISIIVVKH